MDKSHVGMGYNVCPVCGQTHNESVLLHKHMRPVLTRNEFLGWVMCDEHQKLCHEGYTALIEVNGQPKSLSDADRTGRLMHIRNSVWDQIFNMPLPDQGLCFVDPEAFAKLEAKYEAAHDQHIMEQAEFYGH
jgi:hypothetical protein